MNRNTHLLSALGVGFAALIAPVAAQHSQVTAVAANPNDPTEIWVANRDNNSVSIVDTTSGATLTEIAVGIKPRSLAFSPDGTQLFVANQRGNVPHDVHFQTPFTGLEVRGSLSVIDVNAKAVVNTLPDIEVGVEPYGVAVAPNGKYFAVTAFRSGWITLFDVATHAQLARHDFNANLNLIPGGLTIGDLDSNMDGLSDQQDPRGFVIHADSDRIYVTHNKSPFISVMSVSLDGNGTPTAIASDSKIDIDTYPFHPIFNPVNVQELKSQGTPRFMEDIALSPDGLLALVPHTLHNVNHDVNFNWTSLDPNFAGDFANRVYPALTGIDTVTNTYDPGNDNSRRLHHELSDTLNPAEYVPFGEPGNAGTQQVVVGGEGSPVLAANATFKLDYQLEPGESAVLYVGRFLQVDLGAAGTLLSNGRFKRPFVGDTAEWFVPGYFGGIVLSAQAVILNGQGQIVKLSNGVKVVPGADGFDPNELGYRAGHPSRVLFNAAGDRAIMLNRGSEDVFLFNVGDDGNGGKDLSLNTVYPERHAFVERAPLDTTTPLGDLPLGWALVDDTSTTNDDSLLYIVNELTRSLTTLRINWATRTVFKEADQIPLLTGPDIFSQSVLLGNEIFEDASRDQTTGNFNNSCASCHFEGGDDANVWQRPAGPRSTMPVYGGAPMTGSILWKGVRFNMGETGPMFGGENGGHGIFTDEEQQGLLDYHNTISVPLNPNWDLNTSSLTALAELGQDLYFGENATGMNPSGRSAGCAACHPKIDVLGSTAFFTADIFTAFPDVAIGENAELVDPFCFSLQENIMNAQIRNVNSGVNVDESGDGMPDLDRNSDGWIDIETYTPLNADDHDDFTRDDPNSYLCPSDPDDPNSPLKVFTRAPGNFSIPTKLGAFSTPPYMHDHSLYSLRTLVDPVAQQEDPVYGSPGQLPGNPDYNGVLKWFNEFHDLRGHEDFVQGASKVQIDLNSTDVDADIEAILAFISSL